MRLTYGHAPRDSLMAWRLTRAGGSLDSGIRRSAANKMKVQSVRPGRGAIAAKFTAAGAALLLATIVAGASYANEAASGGSDWEEVDQVLVLPSVYQPVGRASNQAGAANPSAPDSASAGSSASAPATSPDCPAPPATLDDGGAAAAAAAQGCVPADGSDPQAQQAAADAAQLDSDSSPADLGSLEAYQEQQAAAEELGASGVIQMPVVIVGPPIVPYYLPRTYAPSAPVMRHAYVPAPTFPPSAWMPPPMTRLPPFQPMTLGAMRGGIGGFGATAPMAGFRGGMGGFHGAMGGFRGR